MLKKVGLPKLYYKRDEFQHFAHYIKINFGQ